jgi:transposase
MCGRWKRGQQKQALGYSRGGFSTKVHGVCDALGNPLGFILTAGQAADCKYALPLIANLSSLALLADKGYDSNEILEYCERNNTTAVIPPKKNRRVTRIYDKHLYKERHKIECLFGFLKHYRRLFSRFEKLASRFSAFLHFVAALQWLK